MDFSIFPVPALFAVSVVAVIIVQTINAKFAKDNDGGVKTLLFRNSIFMFFMALVLFALNGFKIKLSLYTVIMALLFGGVTMISYVTTLQAYKFGPYGYTSVIVSLSTVISALSGYFFWDEPFGVYKIIGVTLMAFCFIFAVENKKDDAEKKVNFKWFLLSIISMILAAVIGILQKVHQNSDYKNELMPFLVVSFVFSTILCFVTYLFLRKKGEKFLPVSDNKALLRLFLITALVGIFSAINNCFNLYLAGVVDSAIMFPIVNGIPLMAGILISFILFKEKISKKQLIGLIVGLIAIVFLCI